MIRQLSLLSVSRLVINIRIAIISCFLVGLPGLAIAEQPLTKIAFGSCIRQDKPQPIWNAVNAYHPEVFVLTGDNIYGDSEDMKVLRAKYDLLGNDEGLSIRNLDDGLMHIGTQYCSNLATPRCRACPIRALCRGTREAPELIERYRT